MAAANIATLPPFLSIAEYLNTDYEPDADYVDGVIEERNVGETDHSKVQGQLYFLLRIHEEAWRILPLPEVRVQVAPTRFRVPDVCVAREGGADEPIVTHPPLLCLEVLSPGDSVARTRRRAQDFFDMGVPEVWIFDPQKRIVYICTTGSTTEQTEGILRLAGTAIELSIADESSTL